MYGICQNCSEGVEPGRKVCAAHLKILSEKSRELREECQVFNTCYRCKEPRRPGGLLCQKHRDEVTAKERRARTGKKQITSLNLAYKTRCPLLKANLLTVKDLTEKTAEELLALWKFGSQGLKEIRRELAKLGLALRGELIEPPPKL